MIVLKTNAYSCITKVKTNEDARSKNVLHKNIHRHDNCYHREDFMAQLSNSNFQKTTRVGSIAIIEIAISNNTRY